MVTLHRQGCPGASDFTNVCCFLLLGLSLFPTTSSAAVLRHTEPHRSRSSSTDSSDTQVTSEAIERLSKVFGIDKPPIRIHHRAPPQYMVDLYNSIAYQSGITKHTKLLMMRMWFEVCPIEVSNYIALLLLITSMHFDIVLRTFLL